MRSRSARNSASPIEPATAVPSAGHEPGAPATLSVTGVRRRCGRRVHDDGPAREPGTLDRTPSGRPRGTSQRAPGRLPRVAVDRPLPPRGSDRARSSSRRWRCRRRTNATGRSSSTDSSVPSAPRSAHYRRPCHDRNHVAHRGRAARPQLRRRRPGASRPTLLRHDVGHLPRVAGQRVHRQPLRGDVRRHGAPPPHLGGAPLDRSPQRPRPRRHRPPHAVHGGRTVRHGRVHVVLPRRRQLLGSRRAHRHRPPSACRLLAAEHGRDTRDLRPLPMDPRAVVGIGRRARCRPRVAGDGHRDMGARQPGDLDTDVPASRRVHGGRGGSSRAARARGTRSARPRRRGVRGGGERRRQPPARHRPEYSPDAAPDLLGDARHRRHLPARSRLDHRAVAVDRAGRSSAASLSPASSRSARIS